MPWFGDKIVTLMYRENGAMVSHAVYVRDLRNTVVELNRQGVYWALYVDGKFQVQSSNNFMGDVGTSRV